MHPAMANQRRADTSQIANAPHLILTACVTANNSQLYICVGTAALVGKRSGWGINDDDKQDAEVATPRTIVVVPQSVLLDKAATSLREMVRMTPGMTLGSGEGGNAFGDRVFIRGFDARNDMFINGMRESGVTTRETFMAEQVEILEGPASTIAGRGTTGGVVNVITKQPLARNFQDIAVTGGTDASRRITADINQNLSDRIAVRINGLFHQADVAGRDHVFDNRYGGSIATVWRPTDEIKIFADYYHTNRMNL